MRSMSEIAPDALLGEVETATVLNLSVRTLQAWRSKRTGPSFIRAGRAIRYRRQDLCVWMEANTVSPSQGHIQPIGRLP